MPLCSVTQCLNYERAATGIKITQVYPVNAEKVIPTTHASRLIMCIKRAKESVWAGGYSGEMF